MILEQLRNYAQTAEARDGTPLLADPAFPSLKEVHWTITVNHTGECLGIEKTGNEVKRKGKTEWAFKEYRIPAIGDRASEKQASLLCDVTSYVFGVGPWSVKTKKDGTVEDNSNRHSAHCRTFSKVLRLARKAKRDEPALRAATLFVFRYRHQFESLLMSYGLWVNDKGKSRLKDSERFAFVLSDDNGKPSFTRPALKTYWGELHRNRAASKTANRAAAPCLVCGDKCPPVANHERKIEGIPGGGTGGVKLLSFDKASFCSQGFSQSLNAPTCQQCVDAYTLALNHLLEENRPTNFLDHESKLAYVFWSRTPQQFDLNATYIQADSKAVGDLYESISQPRKHDAISESDADKFFVLVLSAGRSRAVVRDWIETHLTSVQRNIANWFRDLTIILDRPWPSADEPRAAASEVFGYFPLRRLCRAIGRKANRGWEIPAEISARLFRAGLTGAVLPDSVLAAATRRIRADHDVPPHRAALMKLALNRLMRARKKGELEMTECLDEERPDSAYVCGRLLAVLERIQQRALKDVNATVIDRYFGAASTAPRLILARLVVKAENHLGKLRGEMPGAADNLQKDLESVIAKIGDPANWIGDLPPYLDLEAQGRFAIGFYHQRAEYRSKRKKPSNPDNDNQNDTEHQTSDQ